METGPRNKTQAREKTPLWPELSYWTTNDSCDHVRGFRVCVLKNPGEIGAVGVGGMDVNLSCLVPRPSLSLNLNLKPVFNVS